jgi:hypothetical protein
MIEETLQQAIALARTGQKNQAQELLQQVLSANPANESAWLWLTDCVNTRAERIEVLETCLRFVPESQIARAALAALGAQAGAGSEQAPDDSESLAWGETPPAQEPPSPASAAPLLEADEGAGLPDSAGEPAEEEENEWPKLRDQIRLEPWMQDMANEAGPALALCSATKENPGDCSARPKHMTTCQPYPSVALKYRRHLLCHRKKSPMKNSAQSRRAPKPNCVNAPSSAR